LFLPEKGFAVFAGLVFLVASWEWTTLCHIDRPINRGIYVLITLGLMAGLAHFAGVFTELSLDVVKPVLLVAGVLWAVLLLWVQSYPASTALWSAQWLRFLLGFLVLLPSWLAFVYLRSLDYGVWLLIYLVAVVAAADIGAYFSGKAWGKAKLAPNVSPGKSWAGFNGGLAAAVLLAVIVAAFGVWHQAGFVQAALVSAIAAMSSVLGDLFESMMKRHRGIKDSSQLLPGHGGVLDRMDGWLCAAPVFALFVLLMGW
jgi:phosphatidate cytidylyltransferase